jgi:hypothetical protein
MLGTNKIFLGKRRCDLVEKYGFLKRRRVDLKMQRD